MRKSEISDGFTEGRNRDHQSVLARWRDVERLNAIWSLQPSAISIFDQVVSLPEMEAALSTAQEQDEEILTSELSGDLTSAFGALRENCPKNLRDLDARERVPEGVRGGLTGTARDYLMQRLMTVRSLSSMRQSTGTLPGPLEQSFHSELRRLATFLIAIERAEAEPEARKAA